MSYVICRVWESQTQRHVPYQPRMEKGRFKISVFGSDVFISTAALRSVIFFMLLLAAALKIQTDLEITFLPNLNFKHQKIYNKTLAKCSGSEWKKKKTIIHPWHYTGFSHFIHQSSALIWTASLYSPQVLREREGEGVGEGKGDARFGSNSPPDAVQINQKTPHGVLILLPAGLNMRECVSRCVGVNQFTVLL